MNDPNCLTAPDECQCCVLDDKGNRCLQRLRFWVGTNDVDDYTCVCGDHVQDVKQTSDAVVKL